MRETEHRSRVAAVLGDATGAVADLGVLVPLAAALILVNGLDAGAVLIGAGLLVIAAGVVFRIPFPVQPLKALTAVAVAGRLAPDVIHAAGLEIGAFLLVLSMRRVADTVARIFTKAVVRALQLGVGLLLVITAARLVVDPPAVFRGTPPSPWPVVLAIAAFAVVSWEARRRRYGLALAALFAGVAAAWIVARPAAAAPSFEVPEVSFPPLSAFGAAFFVLVIPQLPLTFGNAVVAVSELAHEYFGERGRRVTPSRVCLTSGLANLTSAAIGGMPMCHGAGGLTAHVRLGARSAGMNAGLGTVLVVLGLVFAAQIPVVLGLLPVWALAAFLAYAGVRHAWLVTDLRRGPLAVAIVAGVSGAVVGNLAITAGVALAADHALRRARGERYLGTGPRPGSYSSSSKRSSKRTTTSPATHRSPVHPDASDV